MMSEFIGKTVLITGSSAGLGMGFAIEFAKHGANLTVCGRDETRLHNVAEACRKAARDAGHNVNVIGVSGDITSPEVRAKTLSRTLEVFGRLDVLVANHGIHSPTPDLASLTEEGFDSQFNGSVRSRLFLIQAAVPYLEKTKGCILTTSSVYSTLAGRGEIGYHMSMAAVDHMVRCLALELGPKGIRVNAINPTTVTGTMLARYVNKDIAEVPVFKFFGEQHPLYGRVSTLEEQATVAVFLCSDAAKFLSGECVKVDGAVSAKGNPANYFTPPENAN